MKIPVQISMLFLIVAISLASAAGQAKRAKPFFIPCAKALQVSLEKLEALHSAESKRRARGETDSGTEDAATVGALKNYISCRRAKTAAELKALTDADAAAVAGLKHQETMAVNLARLRFDNLIPGVSWDEKGADSINYPMTLRGVALIEDFKGALAYSYGLDVEPSVGGAEMQAEADEKTIQKILNGMDARQFEDAAEQINYKAKLTKFRAAINRFLKDNSDRAPSEKVAATDFIVKLLRLGLSEN